MTVSSTEGVTNGIFAPANAAAADTSSTQADSDTFLQLMVAQMQYQDPMNPTSTSDMLSQNATYTEVESIQEVQNEMEEMLSSQLAFGAASMIGQQVSWTDADGNVKTGTVSGTTFTATGPTLSVGDDTVPVTSVTDVGTTAANASAGTTTGSSSSSQS